METAEFEATSAAVKLVRSLVSFFNLLECTTYLMEMKPQFAAVSTDFCTSKSNPKKNS